MASARCYTKSGSVEKYESNLWVSPIGGNWSTAGVVGTITTPDSNGNYTVTPANGFEDSSDTTTYYCFTEYGGVKKTFYFRKVTQQHQYALRLEVEFVFDPLIYMDCGALLTTVGFGPIETDNPNKFHLLDVKSDGSGEFHTVNIAAMNSASEPTIDDFGITVNSGYGETTVVYGIDNFKVYTYGKYRDSGLTDKWNYIQDAMASGLYVAKIS